MRLIRLNKESNQTIFFKCIHYFSSSLYVNLNLILVILLGVVFILYYKLFIMFYTISQHNLTDVKFTEDKNNIIIFFS